MEFAIQTSGPYEDVLAAARWAEDRGLAAVALPDHYLMARDEAQAAITPANDALIQLAGLARETSTIELLCLVSPITFRHPAVLLKSAVTIDRMSSGRFGLGVGTGWLDREHEVFGFDYPPLAERFDRLEEALAYLRAGLAEANEGFTGTHYRLEPFPLAPPPAGRLPLVVGGTGPARTPYLAGTYADEFNCYPGPAEEFAGRVEAARAAAVAAGRDPDDLRISSAGQVVAAATRSEFEAKLDEIAREANVSRADLDAAYERRRTPRGTFDEVRKQLGDLERAGVSRFYFQVGRFDADAVTQLLDGLAG